MTVVNKLPFLASEERVHLIIGYTAFFLPLILWGMTFTGFSCFPASISHFYYIPIAGELFVGALAFIGMCMVFVYRVDTAAHRYTLDVLLTRLAGICAISVAIFPTRGTGCRLDGETQRLFLSNAQGGFDLAQTLLPQSKQNSLCGGLEQNAQAVSGDSSAMQGCLHTDLMTHLGVQSLFWANFHYVAVALLFSILFYFTLIVFRRVQIETDCINGVLIPPKVRRNRIYFWCSMFLSFAVIAIGAATVSEWYLGHLAPWWEQYRLTFVFEAIGLTAFGMAWLVKGRFVPWLVS